MKRVRNASQAFFDLARLKMTGGLANDPGSLSTSSPKILVFGYMGLGDLLMLAPALQALKEKWPASHVTLLTGPYSAAADVASLLPSVDEILPYDWMKADGRQKKSFGDEIRIRNFDALLATYTAPVRYFLPLLAKIPIRVGTLRSIPYPHPFLHPLAALRWKIRMNFFEEEFFKRRFFNRVIRVDQSGEHENEKNRRLVKKLTGAIAKLPSVRLKPTALSPSLENEIETLTQKRRKKLIVVHPSVSAGQIWKGWPVDRYGKLMERLLQSPDNCLVVVGTQDEAANVASVVSQLPADRVLNLMGRTKISEMLALLKLSALFVGGDSGPGHLALAAELPTVRIFGPSDQPGYAAWGAGPARDVTVNIVCRPCLVSGIEKPGALTYKTCGHRACLTTLNPETVFQLCQELLQPPLHR